MSARPRDPSRLGPFPLGVRGGEEGLACTVIVKKEEVVVAESAMMMLSKVELGFRVLEEGIGRR
jgi:hypothetical protein